jgi:hypothetical protein
MIISVPATGSILIRWLYLQLLNSVSAARFEIGLKPGPDLSPPDIIIADGPGKVGKTCKTGDMIDADKR